MISKENRQKLIPSFHFIAFGQMESCELREYIRELEAHIRLIESRMEKYDVQHQLYENELSRTPRAC